ncbi:trace amine-associated receptor 6-like [Silurus meridionalis]|uniref:trace amine-associated receptor 6-like n=1 Tax=Silurus meridionalis TaxID=175797 RepID=UPI001EEC7D9A|nr:trace amine-associated receptor 6-like [Silurus meridionalis]
MDPARIQAIRDWPAPTFRRQLQRFLGFANFYGRLIKSYSLVAALLHHLMSFLHSLLWGLKAEKVFFELKQQFTKAPILIFPNQAWKFVVKVDASNIAVSQLYVCSAAVVLLTVCGNLLVIISVLHFKQLHTPSNILVFSLAVSDFFIGALVMPLMLIWIIESCWIFGRSFCISFWLIGSLGLVLSIYNIALISVDRYLALSNPFFYTDTISTSIMCTVERKAAKVLGILVAVFLACLLPYFIYSLLGGVIEIQAETICKLILLNYISSTINPFIYALFYPWFRRCIKLIITLQIFQTDSALINVLS